MTQYSIDLDRLLKLRLIVARFGEMDLAKWWNTKGQLGRLGATALRRGFPRTHHFAQARSTFAVAAPLLEDMVPVSVEGGDGVLAIKCILRENGYYAYVVLDFPNYRLKAEVRGEEGLKDDGSAEVAEITLEIERFFWDWNGNGCLEVWADCTECLGRCEAFLPVNVIMDHKAYEERVAALKAEIAKRPRRSQPPTITA